MEEHIVFFDFDGVIANTFQLSLDILRTQKPQYTEEEYRLRFHDNISRFITRADIRVENFVELYEEGMLETESFHDIAHQIVKISNAYPCIIVSSTMTNLISTYLTHHSLRQCFVKILGFDVSHSKIEKFQMAFDKFHVPLSKCVFITDTVGDIREAHELAIPSIAVTWGFHSRETLLKGNPQAIIDSPLQLYQTVENIFRKS